MENLVVLFGVVEPPAGIPGGGRESSTPAARRTTAKGGSDRKQIHPRQENRGRKS